MPSLRLISTFPSGMLTSRLPIDRWNRTRAQTRAPVCEAGVTLRAGVTLQQAEAPDAPRQ